MDVLHSVPRRWAHAIAGTAPLVVRSEPTRWSVRVTVNRLWGRLFDRGIVATLDTSGCEWGRPPTHPGICCCTCRGSPMPVSESRSKKTDRSNPRSPGVVLHSGVDRSERLRSAAWAQLPGWGLSNRNLPCSVRFDTRAARRRVAWLGRGFLPPNNQAVSIRSGREPVFLLGQSTGRGCRALQRKSINATAGLIQNLKQRGFAR